MLRNEDIEAGISKGVITRDQADALWQLASERRTNRRFTNADDERFRFMGGFNDVFLALGVALLAIGLFTVPAMMGVEYFGKNPISLVIALFGPLAILWALAEFLTRSRRLILPSIVLITAMCWIGGLLFSTLATAPFLAAGITKPEIASAVGAATPYFLASLCIAAAFYLRFRLPFALLLAAGSLVIATISIVGAIAPQEFVSHILMPTVFVLGLAIFWAAMFYDTSDPQRLTRRSDCAFWLHILAAPTIVHSLIKMLATVPTYETTFTSNRSESIFELLFSPIEFDTWTVTIILAVFVVMSLIALVIDRRALLVSTLIYIGSIIAYVISSLDAETIGTTTNNLDTVTFGAPLLIIGALVIFLGTAWTPLRSYAVNALPLGPIRNSIPPARQIPA